MRVLAIDEALPYPTDSGKRIRTFELLRRLARAHEITLVVPEERETPAEALATVRATGIDVVTVPRAPLKKHGLRFAWDLLRNVPLRAPYMVMGHRVRAVREAVAARVAAARPDVIHVEWTPLVCNVPEGLGVPVVISAHNVESDIWARYVLAERSFVRRAYVRLQHRKVARFERAALAAADGVVAVSDADGARIRAWTGQAHVTVAPNAVDGERFAPDPTAPVDRHELLFTGSLDWRPNQDAVVWFLDEILPRVRARVPEATVRVVGRSPPPWLLEKAASVPGVTVNGSVPDVRPYVARAGVSIVPLRVGGGSRLKIPEALAMERPIVSTTVGAEGLSVEGGLFLADGPEPFAEAIERAIREPAEAARRAAVGRALTLRHHEWGCVEPLLERAWIEAAARGRAAP